MSRHIILWHSPPSVVARQNRGKQLPYFCPLLLLEPSAVSEMVSIKIVPLCTSYKGHARSQLCHIWDFVLWVITCKLSSHFSLEKNFCSDFVLSVLFQKVEDGLEPLFHRRVRQLPLIPRNVRCEPFPFTFLLCAAECSNSTWSLLSHVSTASPQVSPTGSSTCGEVDFAPWYLQMNKRVIRLPPYWQSYLFKWDCLP